jgi:hypothetical protein
VKVLTVLPKGGAAEREKAAKAAAADTSVGGQGDSGKVPPRARV